MGALLEPNAQPTTRVSAGLYDGFVFDDVTMADSGPGMMECVNIDTLATAVVAAISGGLVGALGSMMRTRSTARTAARLVYAELTRNSAPVAYYCAAGRWPQTVMSHDAWERQGEALARIRGAEVFERVYRGYSSVEAVAYIAGDVTIAEEQRSILLEENLSYLRDALQAVGDQASIPERQVLLEQERLTLPAVPVTLSAPASAPPSLLTQLADMQRARGLPLSPTLEAAAVVSTAPPVVASVAVVLNRRVYDAMSTEVDAPDHLTLARREGQSPTGDRAVDETYDAIGLTQTFLTQAYASPPLLPPGAPFEAVVHWGDQFNNVFWNGQRVIVGDGDGDLMLRFYGLDVIAHEICHILTADLEFRGESGAIAESVCDVLGLLVKQWHSGLGVETACWVVGADLLAPSVNGLGLRSLKEPGSAYDDPRLGKDSQVWNMRDYVHTQEDNAGIHINGGIPNHAFYQFATSLGGNAWERAGLVWFRALTSGALTPRTSFANFAGVTGAMAESIFGVESTEAAAAREAWLAVGVAPHLSKRAAAVILRGGAAPTPG